MRHHTFWAERERDSMSKLKVSKNGLNMDLSGCANTVEYKKWKSIWASEYAVCAEWKTFSVFYDWVSGRAKPGMQLTCRFIGDGKMHSPDTSVFVPPYIRQVFRINKEERGVETGTPLGVTKNNRGDKYRARSTFNGKIYRGPSRSWPEEAHADWQEIKMACLHRAIEVYRKEDCFDQRVEDRILLVINQLTAFNNCGVETQRLL